MNVPIPLARPWLGEAEAEAARATVLSGWVMQGPKVAEFERCFADYVGASHACAVSSGTAALILALKAVGVGHGDVVLTVSHSFIATANAIRACGAEPVFVDIELTGYNLDPKALARVLGSECRRDGEFLAGDCHVNHVDFAALAKQKRLGLGVPARFGVAIVHACFQERVYGRNQNLV